MRPTIGARAADVAIGPVVANPDGYPIAVWNELMPTSAKELLARGVAGELGAHPARLRREIRHSRSRALRQRRGIVGASLIGIASMVPVVLYQTGVIRHLPDPPVGNFDSDKVNGSTTAFGYGGGDAPLSMLAHATNLMLAAFGGEERDRARPWLSLTASAIAGAQAGVAARYLFHQMPKVDKAWCPYCITDAVMHMGTFALTVPGAARALRGLGRRR